MRMPGPLAGSPGWSLGAGDVPGWERPRPVRGKAITRALWRSYDFPSICWVPGLEGMFKCPLSSVWAGTRQWQLAETDDMSEHYLDILDTYSMLADIAGNHGSDEAFFYLLDQEGGAQ